MPEQYPPARPALARMALFCLLAGFFYAFYLILAQSARVKLGNWSLLAWSSLVGSPVLLGVALALGEPVWPTVWWPVVTLALSSQIFGQGLLVYSLRHFPPLVIGLRWYLRRAKDGLRLLGSGELKAKVDITVDHATATAKAAVEKAGGKVSVIEQKVLEADEAKRKKTAAKKAKAAS